MRINSSCLFDKEKVKQFIAYHRMLFGEIGNGIEIVNDVEGDKTFDCASLLGVKKDRETFGLEDFLLELEVNTDLYSMRLPSMNWIDIYSTGNRYIENMYVTGDESQDSLMIRFMTGDIHIRNLYIDKITSISLNGIAYLVDNIIVQTTDRHIMRFHNVKSKSMIKYNKNTIVGESTQSLHDKLIYAAKNLDTHLTHKMNTLTNGRWGSIVLPEKKNLIDFSERGVIILDDFKLRLDEIPDEVWDMIIKEGEG